MVLYYGGSRHRPAVTGRCRSHVTVVVCPLFSDSDLPTCNFNSFVFNNTWAAVKRAKRTRNNDVNSNIRTQSLLKIPFLQICTNGRLHSCHGQCQPCTDCPCKACQISWLITMGRPHRHQVCVGLEKFVIFNQFFTISVKWCKIGTQSSFWSPTPDLMG